MKKYILPEEMERYVLTKPRDKVILHKIHEMENLRLNKNERFLVSLIRSQLEADWRNPLLTVLNKFLKNKKSKKRWDKLKEIKFWVPK